MDKEMINNTNIYINLELTRFEQKFDLVQEILQEKLEHTENSELDIYLLTQTQKKLEAFIKNIPLLMESKSSSIEFKEKIDNLQKKFSHSIQFWIDVNDASKNKISSKEEKKSYPIASNKPQENPVTKFRVSGKEVHPSHMVEFPAVGISNDGNNCWANSLLQMILNSESISKKILDSKNNNTLGELVELLQNYYQSQIDGSNISSVQSENLRHLARGWNQTISASGQEDPFDVLVNIFEKIKFTQPILHTITSHVKGVKKQSTKRELHPIIDLSLTSSKSVKFEEIFSKEFTYNSDEGHQFQLKFEEVPSDLFIRVKRFEQVIDDGQFLRENKLDTHIEVPINFTLDAKLISQNQSIQQPANFECTGCIIHIGDSTKSGHYVAVEKKGNTWYLINDSFSKEISEAEAQVHLGQGYIFHFTRRNKALIPKQQVNTSNAYIIASWMLRATAMTAKGIFFGVKYTLSKSVSLLGKFVFSKKKTD